ncbi:MAG: ABC-F family ATP-binding cassette domain-containing protein [Erysipelotrichaceae bacterium]|nr:ABC-F family ATP-binding cassette domain-containing protein [Erysipelotrichaceae bacterium]
MLKINNLTITTHKGRILLKDFSFVLNDRDKIALIGEEGNGKSTILKVLAGVDVSDYVSYTGNILADGKIAYLPQTIPQEDLDRNTVEYISSEMDYSHLYSLLNRFHVDDSLFDDRIIRTLSGGEKVRLSILKLLYEDPDIILMDEPTNDLDLPTLLWLEDFINELKKPLIFVSHDEVLLEACANGILHLEQLKRKTESVITYSGNGYRDYVERRTALIDRTNMIARKEKAQYNKQLEKWRQIYQKVDHKQKTASRQDPHGAALLKKKMHSVISQSKQLEVKKENLTKKYEPEEAINIFYPDVRMDPHKVILDLYIAELKNENRILSRNIDLQVYGQDKICIIGNNGCGKSTLMKEIYSLLKDRQDIRLGYIPQNYSEVIDLSLTPVQYLWNGEDAHRRSMIQSYLGALKFTAEEMEHQISDLSEGQKCKILIIKTILDECDVLLLDEPTRNLSALSNPVFRSILKDFNGCIIAVSHDRKFIDEVAETVYEMNENGLRELQESIVKEA